MFVTKVKRIQLLHKRRLYRMHKFGENWPYRLRESISIGLFKNILGIMPEVDLNKNSVVFMFLLP